ncbi:MAG: hypothetical protein JWQ35_1745 [Bacteriovoracaceae bacterium]|nr:hypothetical protein [Bacteriovoracaceae bacterium]
MLNERVRYLHFPFFVFLILASLPFSAPLLAANENPKNCSGDTPETTPAKVKLNEIYRDILLFKDSFGRVIVKKISPEFETALRSLFSEDVRSISKLEQFYGLLFYLVKFKTLSDDDISFDPESSLRLLLSTKVFTNPTIPKHISSIHVSYNPAKEKASFDVKFDTNEVHLPLNQGKGFSNFREGLCQEAKELIFYGGFQFDIELTVSNNHVFASNFKGVDLFGIFGSRGIVNVDIQYVSLRSVEFLGGSAMGIVRAKVSKVEFEKNPHSVVLQILSSLVTDKSTQAIDW